MDNNIVNSEMIRLKERLLKSGIDISDTTIDDIIVNFEESIPKEYKKKHGIVYTPQWISDGMSELAIHKWLIIKSGIDITIEDDRGKLISALECIKNIKICDPCVGAGIYIFSIIETLQNIYKIIHEKLNTEYNKLDTLKHIVNNNIYCIDIDSNAVMISRFRLWAFLCYNGYEGNFENFNCNIYTGDAISNLYEGLNIEYNQDLQGVQPEYRDIYIDDWTDAWGRYVESKQNASNNRTIYNLKSDLYNIAMEISSTLSGIQIPFKIDWKILKNGRLKLFNWFLEFEEVFRENGGFDVIISNPPYVRNSNIQILEDDSVDKSADLYIHFLNLWKSYGNESCVSCMITPNNWFSAAYADKFRKDNLHNIDTIIDFNMHYVFEGVYTATAISVMRHNIEERNYINYANAENIMSDNKTDRFIMYTNDKMIKSAIKYIDNGNKFIFADNKLYEIINRLNKLPKLSEQYKVNAYKGRVVTEENRVKAKSDSTGPFLAMGKDTNLFTTLQKTNTICNYNVENTYDNCIIIPEVTRRIRACRIRNIIPLDSLLVIECDNPNILGLINSEIFDILYNIMVNTNYCISYAEVRFPRKNRQIVNVPVPTNISKLEEIRIRTNNYETVSEDDIKQINEIVQGLYGISDEELDKLREYNI